MKKTIIAFLLALTLLSSCGNDTKKTPTWEDENENVVIADFEKWGPDFQLLGLINDFGKVTRNENKSYVHSGEYSAFVRPLGQYNHPDKKPLLYLPLISKTFAYNHSDITRLNDVKCYVYNDSSVEKTVTIGFLSEIRAYGYITKIEGQTYSLAPKQWTRITYLPNLGYLSNKFDLTSAAAFYFEFEHTNSRELSDAPSFYLDDISFELSRKEKKIEEPFFLKENEICDFEEDFQGSHLEAGWPDAIIDIFTYKIIEGSYHGLAPTSGKRMLHVSVNKGNTNQANWALIALTANYMQKTKMKEIPQEDISNWKIVFDLAGFGPSAQKVVPHQYKLNDESMTSQIYSYTFDAYDSQWKTFEMPILDEHYHITSNPGRFVFSLPEELYAYEIFIDNIRLERK